MKLSRALRPVVAAALTVTALGTGLATPVAAATAGHVVERPLGNVVSIFGEAGDPVSAGQTHVWRNGPDRVSMAPSGDGVVVRAGTPGGEQFEFVVLPKLDGFLTNGEAPDATPTPTATNGALKVVGGGRSCPGGSTGHYNVLDQSADAGRLWVTFEQRCAGAAGSMFGEIRINQENDPSLLIAPMRYQFSAKPLGPDGGAVPVTLVNTGSTPLTIRSADIVGAPGYGPLKPIGDDNFGVGGTIGFAITGSTCGTLQPGQNCVVTVTYRPLLATPVEAHLSLTDSTAAGHHEMSVGAPSALVLGGEWEG